MNSKSPGITSRTVLADYIRNTANLKGTKVLCREGGCGVCIVTVKTIDPGTGSQVIKSINSVNCCSLFEVGNNLSLLWKQLLNDDALLPDLSVWLQYWVVMVGTFRLLNDLEISMKVIMKFRTDLWNFTERRWVRSQHFVVVWINTFFHFCNISFYSQCGFCTPGMVMSMYR